MDGEFSAGGKRRGGNQNHRPSTGAPNQVLRVRRRYRAGIAIARPATAILRGKNVAVSRKRQRAEDAMFCRHRRGMDY
jgi:hypothetical protein